MSGAEPVTTREAARTRPDEVVTALEELSLALVTDAGVQETLQRVVDLCVRTVPGCDMAGVTLLSGARPDTVAYTDPRVLTIDRDQYVTGEGPCLDAIRRCGVNLVDVEQAADRWPRFAKVAFGEGIRSFLATPLVAEGEALGALNLYGESAAAFDRLDEAFVRLLCAQAVGGVVTARRFASARQLAEQLQAAMASRAVIEQAKGVLMSRHGVDAETAFAVLRQKSQERNVKLRAVAEELVASVQQSGEGTG